MNPANFADRVAAAVAAVLANRDSAGTTHELGGPEIFTFRELLETVLRATGRRRLLVPVPFAIMEWNAAVLGLAPEPPLTRDQVRLLRTDNVAEHDLPGLADLGITPTAVAAILPGYLGRYRRGGGLGRRPSAI